MGNWYSENDPKNIRESTIYDAKINYTNTAFGQTFSDYTGPNFFNSLDIDVEKKYKTKTQKCQKY